jgi:hypothetical protein
MSSGFVYLFTNEAMPGIVKIGFSQITLRERSKALETTGVPKKFEIEFAISTLEPQKLEKLLHKHFRKYHYGKEYFKCDIAILVKEIKLFLENEKINYINYEGRASTLYLTEDDQRKIQKEKEKLKELKLQKDLLEKERKHKKLEDINLEKQRQELINDIANKWELEFNESLRRISIDFTKNKKKYSETISGKYLNRSKLWDVGIGISTFLVGNYFLGKIDDSIEKESIAITKTYTLEQALRIKKFQELEVSVINDTSRFVILNKYECLEELKGRFQQKYPNTNSVYITGPSKKRNLSDHRMVETIHYARIFSELIDVLEYFKIHEQEPLNKSQNPPEQENSYEWEVTEWGIKPINKEQTIPISFIEFPKDKNGVYIDYIYKKEFIPATKIKNFEKL